MVRSFRQIAPIVSPHPIWSLTSGVDSLTPLDEEKLNDLNEQIYRALQDLEGDTEKTS